MSESSAGADEIARRVRSDIDRALERNIKGLEFLTAAKPAVGAMAKDTILRHGTMQLYHYRPVVDEIYRIPILIVTPTSNRGYVFDLAPGQSLVEYLLHRGYDVFMLDWLPPRREESTLNLEDYAVKFLTMSLDLVRERSGQASATVLGYCMGGTLSLLHAALFPSRIANLVLFTTPVDFSHMSLFRMWADEKYFDVDRLVEALGNIPGEFILSAFDTMRPANRAAGLVGLWANLGNDEYVKSYRRFDRWAAETLPLAGEYFRQTTKEFLWRNSIMTGSLRIGGQLVKLSNISAPVLSVIAIHDHVVPQSAAHPIVQLLGSTDREELIVKGGHVSVVAGPAAVTRLWPSVDNWLGKRSI